MADFTALRGIVCPVVSPCTSNEGVDYDSLQENLARLLRAPITGFYVCGGTGDGSRLTFAERCRTAELTIAQTRAAGRRTIVHVGQTLQRHALELAEHAMTLGADAGFYIGLVDVLVGIRTQLASGADAVEARAGRRAGTEAETEVEAKAEVVAASNTNRSHTCI